MYNFIAKVIFDSDEQGTPRNQDIKQDVLQIKMMIQSKFANEDGRPVSPDVAIPGSSYLDSVEKFAKESLCVILYITEDFYKNYWTKFISDSAYLGEILSANPGRIIPIVKGTAKVPRQAHLQNRLGFTDHITDVRAKLWKAIRSIKLELGEDDTHQKIGGTNATFTSLDPFEFFHLNPGDVVTGEFQSGNDSKSTDTATGFELGNDVFHAQGGRVGKSTDTDLELHQRVLSKSRVLFNEKITDINLLLDQMMDEELILNSKLRDIREQTTTSEKIRMLMTNAIAMDKEWYMRFKICLELSGHSHILGALNDKEERLKSGILHSWTRNSRRNIHSDESQSYIINALEELKHNEQLRIEQGQRLEKRMVEVLLITGLIFVVCLLTRK